MKLLEILNDSMPVSRACTSAAQALAEHFGLSYTPPS